jgi:hypothetical protein
MASQTSNELLAAIRRLPLEERSRIIAQATRDVEEDTPSPPVAIADAAQTLLGLFSDEPDLADAVCSFAYESRTSARMRNPE